MDIVGPLTDLLLCALGLGLAAGAARAWWTALPPKGRGARRVGRDEAARASDASEA